MLIHDLVPAGELAGFLNQYIADRERNQFTLAQFLPNAQTPNGGMTYEAVKARMKRANAAVFRALDTPPGIGRRQGFESVRGSIAALSQGMRLNEYDILADYTRIPGSKGALINAIFDDQAQNAEAIASRIELARGQLLLTAKHDINEDGFIQQVDFGRPALNNQVVGVTWNNTATSTPLTDEKALIQQYKSVNQQRSPGVAIMSQVAYDWMVQSQQFKNLASVGAMVPSILTSGTVEAIRREHGLPPIFIYDTEVMVNDVSTRVLPQHTVIYLPAAGLSYGETLYGITAEARELVEARQLPAEAMSGVTGTIIKNYKPVSVESWASALCLPILTAAEATATLRVLP